MKPPGYSKNTPSRDAHAAPNPAKCPMHLVQPTAGLNIETGPDSTRSSVVRQRFEDTSTWGEIIRILEEEALKKFAIAERVPQLTFAHKAYLLRRKRNV